MNAHAPSQRLNILVVEDEAMIAMFLEDMLSDLGCNVVGPAAAVAPAIALIEAAGTTLHGALLDVNLRGELAYPIADVLLQRKVPFVFATGYAAHGIEPRYAALPAVAKPFPFATLAHIVRTFACRQGTSRMDLVDGHNHLPQRPESSLTLTPQQ